MLSFCYRILAGLLLVVVFTALYIWTTLTVLLFIPFGSNKVLRIVKGYDVLGNTAINGDTKMFISTKAYLKSEESKKWGYIRQVIDKVALWLKDPDHCRVSFLTDVRECENFLKEHEHKR